MYSLRKEPHGGGGIRHHHSVRYCLSFLANVSVEDAAEWLESCAVTVLQDPLLEVDGQKNEHMWTQHRTQTQKPETDRAQILMVYQTSSNLIKRAVGWLKV